MSERIRTCADQLWSGRLEGREVEPFGDLSLDEAYAVAALNHERRLQAGERAVGRKIGHTNAKLWPQLGINEPSWGWLYAASTMPWPERLDLSRWREPKAELECVLRLARTPREGEAASACVDALALGLEIVDRPYPDWRLEIGDSIAAGGVHAGLLVGPWQALPSAGLDRLRAMLRTDEGQSEGGSAFVLGSPLLALDALQQLLSRRGAPPLQAGELITTGALAPALPLRAGSGLSAAVEELGELNLRA